MGSYLRICGWGGCKKIPVTVIGETEDDFQIKAVEGAFLPGRGAIKKGQCLSVPKNSVMHSKPDRDAAPLSSL
jgi:hypothetical protein